MAEVNEKRITHTVEDGSVTIPDDVFETMALLAALEVEGVHSINGNITKEKASKISTDTISSWIKADVDGEEKTVKIYVSIELLFGYTIPAVVDAVQNKIKNAIESMTEFTVNVVNVKICGVYTADRD